MNPFIRKLIYRLFAWCPLPNLKAADVPIDVVIPIIRKDLRILPLCLKGVRKCVVHTIKDIYIVAPKDDEIIQFCSSNKLIFVDEKEVFGFCPQDIGLEISYPDGSIRDRSGWLFQQLVKLSGKIGSCRYYLCIDADHVLIRPHVFLTDKCETVFYMSYEMNQPYYDNILRLIPGLKLSALSYVDHKMLFDKNIITKLHLTLSPDSDDAWVKTIIDSYNRSCETGFSEFELYGNFVKYKVLRPWLQKRLPYKMMSDYETLQKKYNGSRWSLTFPDYMKQNKLCR